MKRDERSEGSSRNAAVGVFIGRADPARTFCLLWVKTHGGVQSYFATLKFIFVKKVPVFEQNP